MSSELGMVRESFKTPEGRKMIMRLMIGEIRLQMMKEDRVCKVDHIDALYKLKHELEEVDKEIHNSDSASYLLDTMINMAKNLPKKDKENKV